MFEVAAFVELVVMDEFGIWPHTRLKRNAQSTESVQRPELNQPGRDRDTARATLGQGLAVSAFPAVCARLALSIVHVSVRPPFHPGRSHLASPVGDHDCPCAVFLVLPRLKRSLAYTPRSTRLLHSSIAVCHSQLTRALSPAWAGPDLSVMSESPFAPSRCCLLGSRVSTA